jgi:hypothetical protein
LLHLASDLTAAKCSGESNLTDVWYSGESNLTAAWCSADQILPPLDAAGSQV